MDPATRRSRAWSTIAKRCRLFYDFPAEHWKHLRTMSVIDSSFATAPPHGALQERSVE